MSLLDIDGALIQGYQDMALGLDTAYPNMHFKPPVGNWASIFILPASSGPITALDRGWDMHTGLMQIDFNVKHGTGTSQLLTWAQAVRDQFIAGKGFVKNSQYVRITSTERSPIREVDGWTRISVTVNFEATEIRPAI